jgi:hypothetical protein
MLIRPMFKRRYLGRDHGALAFIQSLTSWSRTRLKKSQKEKVVGDIIVRDTLPFEKPTATTATYEGHAFDWARLASLEQQLCVD